MLISSLQTAAASSIKFKLYCIIKQKKTLIWHALNLWEVINVFELSFRHSKYSIKCSPCLNSARGAIIDNRGEEENEKKIEWKEKWKKLNIDWISAFNWHQRLNINASSCCYSLHHRCLCAAIKALRRRRRPGFVIAFCYFIVCCFSAFMRLWCSLSMQPKWAFKCSNLIEHNNSQITKLFCVVDSSHHAKCELAATVCTRIIARWLTEINQLIIFFFFRDMQAVIRKSSLDDTSRRITKSINSSSIVLRCSYRFLTGTLCKIEVDWLCGGGGLFGINWLGEFQIARFSLHRREEG